MWNSNSENDVNLVMVDRGYRIYANKTVKFTSSVMSSFAHNSQDLVDSSGQPKTSRNDQDFIPGSTGTCVHVSGMSRMSQTLPGHPGSTDTTVRDVPIVTS